MGDKTHIQWCDASWPIVNGCRRISRGCEHCYAERLIATRLRDMPKYKGLSVFKDSGPRWTGEARLWAEHLGWPLKWKWSRRIFVADMGDLFYDGVPDADVDKVVAVTQLAWWHEYIFLTKRADRMASYLLNTRGDNNVLARVNRAALAMQESGEVKLPRGYEHRDGAGWPYANVLMGVSCEDQKTADERGRALRDLAAAGWRTWFSYEPALGPVDFSAHLPCHAPWDGAAPATWDDVNWPEWVPQSVRDEIARFWGEPSSRTPREYAQQHVTNYADAPPFGSRVFVTPRQAPYRTGLAPYEGRYVHAWNNIGRVVMDDGVVKSGVATFECRVIERPPAVSWIVVGGESGPRARPFDVAWARNVVAQCRATNTPVFVKQMGSQPFSHAFWKDGEFCGGVAMDLRHPKGGDMAEWDPALRVREFPKAQTRQESA